MAKRIFAFLGVIFFILVFYFSPWFESDLSISKKEYNHSNADYFFNDLSIKSFDQDGKLINQVNAKKLEHFENEKTSTLISPQIILKETDDRSWSISANKGIHQMSDNILMMQESVVIEQIFSTNDISNTQIKTLADYLNFNLSTNIVNIQNQTTYIKNQTADIKN